MSPGRYAELQDIYTGIFGGVIIGVDDDEPGVVFANVKKYGTAVGPNATVDRDELVAALRRLGIIDPCEVQPGPKA
jgi:hypothetical protein